MNRRILGLLATILICTAAAGNAQSDRWQQRAEYTMQIDFDATKHRFKGFQKLVYANNSPDELSTVFYHLYFNAFQPGSMMDVRSRNIADPDARIGGRINRLKDHEIGYQKIQSLKHNGKAVKYEVVGTILEVQLNEPIPPYSKTEFEMEFEGQVPMQVRRSGRDSKEGIEYSMAQWYPKMCEYDYQGWHANPYIGREFYGIWGDFDVTINIDKDFVLGGTGILQNPQQVGHGYETKGLKLKVPAGDKLSWHFKANNVHDFMWAADRNYSLIKKQAKDGPMMYFLYQKNSRTEDTWLRLPAVMDEAFSFMNKTYGKYPHDAYSFIQGGDGGMEYPMATLITGERSFASLVGVSVHELLHSWFQMVLGTNESLYAWMDEGFTSYASNVVMNYLKGNDLIPGSSAVSNPHIGSYIGYANFSNSGNEEALSTHSDHFMTNSGYGVGSYVKGAIFLNQLKYIIGEQAFDRGMLNYFETWKFKHPNVNDFIRVMEKTSGLELDWYKEYWINTTHTIDYGIKKVTKDGRKDTKVELFRIGLMPMPIDLVITKTDGSKVLYHIPLRIMRGEKPKEFNGIAYKVAGDWPWTHPGYELKLPIKYKKIAKIEIDPSGRMADLFKDNNTFENKEHK